MSVLECVDYLKYHNAHRTLVRSNIVCPMFTELARHPLYRWKINESSLPDGHMFLGVAALNGGSTDGQAPCKTWAFNPPTGNLYIGEKLDEHGAEQLKKHFFEDEKESLLDKMVRSRTQTYGSRLAADRLVPF